jgi:6-phosphogluconolactonase
VGHSIPRPARFVAVLALLLAGAAACERTAVAPTSPEPRAAARSRLVLYASGYAPDIHLFAVDPASGALAPSAGLPAFGTSPSYLAVNPSATNLYALDENTPGRVGAYAIEPSTGHLRFLDSVPSGGRGPAFLSTDATGAFVLVANYEDGTVSVIRVVGGGALGEAVDTRPVGAEAHMIVTDPSNRFVFVPCKGADFIAQFRFDARTGTLAPNAPPRVATAAGAGPRHLAFHPNGRFAYGINENASTMTAYALDSASGTLREIETQSTLPDGFTGHKEAAAVRVHPQGRWLFGSNRGDDSIVIFAVDPDSGRMTRRGFVKTGGATPRDFALDPTGTLLYAANQDSNAIVPFRFDAASGVLDRAGAPALAMPVTAVSFVTLVPLQSRSSPGATP